MSDNVIIEVNGLKIKENSLYKVIDKPDSNAVTGLREHGSTKVPVEFMGNSAGCRFDKAKKVFDTGFYTQSPCYSNLDKSAREQKIRMLQQHIDEPYELDHGDGILDNKNSDFWEEYSYDLFEGKIFNTENIDDLLALYIAILGFELTPKESVGNPMFNESQFCVEDKEVTSKKRNERTQNYMKAMTSFALMLTSEKNKLVSCLKFARMSGSDNLDANTQDSTFQALFHDWINDDVKNVDDFLRVVDKISKKAGLEEVVLFGHLLELSGSNKVVKIGGEYSFKENPLGADLKTAAMNLATRPSLKDIKTQIYKELE
jgi:hypothetical protein